MSIYLSFYLKISEFNNYLNNKSLEMSLYLKRSHARD